MMDGNEIIHHAHEIEKLNREGNYNDTLSLLKDLEHARVTVELLQETDVVKVLYQVLKSCPVATVKKTVKLLLSKWKRLFSKTHPSTGDSSHQKCNTVELTRVTEENGKMACLLGDSPSACFLADSSVLQGDQHDRADCMASEQILSCVESLSDHQAQHHRTLKRVETEGETQNDGGRSVTTVPPALFPQESPGVSAITSATHTSQYDTASSLRSKCAQLLLQALVPEAVGGAECAPQHMALAHCIEEHIFTLHSANLPKYKACVRNKVSNLRNPKSPHLRQGLLSAQLGPEAFARMSTMEMADPELRALREEYMAWGIRERQRPLEVEGTPTDKIRCRHCNQFDCRVTQISRGTLFLPGWVRNRGCDVDMMTFVTCAICGEKWYHSAWICL
ncbi:transcription elongation factor A N-terminal and central domain-containing protein isoform X2 [Megalops cyprinoides]|nr:transcription elongation factor A N-terminal and central domain-containing protein isoform X2 [Megalops cyprinoides]